MKNRTNDNVIKFDEKELTKMGLEILKNLNTIDEKRRKENEMRR